MKPKEAKVAAFFYLSLVNGRAERHRTWLNANAGSKACPARNLKNLRTKLTTAILRSWNASLS